MLLIRDNHLSYASENDCKFIIKYYDADNDGLLDFLDFNFIVLCNDNMKLRAKETQRATKHANILFPEVEKALSDLIEM